MNATSLLFLPQPKRAARMRLVCFSYAGGNASHFMRWLPALHPDAELVICQLPGRGARLFETPYDNMSNLIRDLISAIAALVDKPLIFFGHSMGAKLAYELGLEMQRRALPTPVHTVISAASAPFHRRSGAPIHGFSDTEFIAAVARMGGTPIQILRNAELMSLCLPALRADYKLVETYHNPSRQKVASQLTLLGGIDDAIISVEQLSDWGQLYSNVIEAYWFQGGHFYLNERSDDVLQFLNESVLEFNLRRMDQRRPFFEVAL